MLILMQVPMLMMMMIDVVLTPHPDGAMGKPDKTLFGCR
jgi:hypothetical protein